MNRKIRRKLAAEKTAIERRLRLSLEVKSEGPVVGGSNIHYELADKSAAISHGGIGAIQRLVRKVGLAARIDEHVHVLKAHKPYHESDHVLNVAYNALCGGQTLDDIEHRRMDRVFLTALGARSIPDPTTAGDFCRRFEPEDVVALQDAVNEARLSVWRRQPESFTRATARIDADATIVETAGECKEGMDIRYDGKWGYSALLVSLANTAEPLFIENHGANRPSHEGAAALFDKSIALCRRAGFRDILIRGDTDFSMTANFDRWTNDGVRFVFGYDAKANLIEWGNSAPEEFYAELEQRAERELKTKPRARPENVKERIVRERKYKNIRTTGEDVVDFDYQPANCARSYRVVALRKNLSVERGEDVLFDDIRYFFYITNDSKLTVHAVVDEARRRCNQENLIEQMKNGVRAFRAPVNTLVANWAYMVMTSIAWSIKAWVGLLLPICPRWRDAHEADRERILRMEFRTFVATMIAVPAQIVQSGRRIIYRILAWRPSLPLLFRLVEAL